MIDTHSISLWSDDPAFETEIQHYAKTLGIMISDAAELIVERLTDRWQLRGNFEGAPGVVSIDFCDDKTLWRLKNPGTGKQPLASAIGIKKSHRPTVLDCTAGLGKDAFLLATLGSQVYLTERHPVVHLLLEDGLTRAQQHPSLAPIFKHNMQLTGDTLDDARAKLPEAPDVIYMDPMYPKPHHKKTAQVKKEMQLLRYLVGPDDDADQWLQKARNWSEKVVVKRPNWAEPLATDIHSSVKGKNHRYDIYRGVSG
ncbi:MAG TPA: hypothetical protein ENJ60_11525 [Aeromonadales bacterium]|nr:hypothetical protein [Aeromonadales bacterium]